MQIQDTVQLELNKLVEAGTVNKIIQTQLEETVKSIFRDMLRDYSDFGKELKKAVGEALKIDLTKLTILDYNSIVCKIVSEELDKCVIESIQQPVSESIKSYMGALEKKEWRLSEIIETYIDHLKTENSSGEITLIVNTDNWGTWHVYFDEDNDKKQYDCEFQLDIDKSGKVYSFQAGRWHPHKGDLRERPIHGSFDAFMFKLYAGEATVINDEGHCRTEWYIND
jgi:hypothetical protein